MRHKGTRNLWLTMMVLSALVLFLPVAAIAQPFEEPPMAASAAVACDQDKAGQIIEESTVHRIDDHGADRPLTVEMHRHAPIFVLPRTEPCFDAWLERLRISQEKETPVRFTYDYRDQRLTSVVLPAAPTAASCDHPEQDRPIERGIVHRIDGFEPDRPLEIHIGAHAPIFFLPRSEPCFESGSRACTPVSKRKFRFALPMP